MNIELMKRKLYKPVDYLNDEMPLDRIELNKLNFDIMFVDV